MQSLSKKTYLLLLFFFVAKINNAQTLNHAQSFSSTGNNVPHAILADAQGNSYVTGSFNDSCDFDGGSNQFILNGVNDGYVCKFSPSGQILWAFPIGSGGVDECLALAFNQVGYIMVSGVFSGTVDFDPSNNNFDLTASGSNNAFVAWYDDAGNFLNAISFGGNQITKVNCMSITNNQQILIGGYFTGDVDFDPSTNTSLKTAQGAGDGFVLCLDPAGNFNWVNIFGGNDLFSIDEVTGITEHLSGDLFTCGYFANNIDLDPGAGTVTANANGLFDLFVCRTNANGQYSNAFAMGGSGMDLANALVASPQGNIILSGSFEATMDADPQATVNTINSNGMSDAFWLCLDEQFNFQWLNQIGGIENDVAGNVWCDGLANVYTGGHFSNQVDLNPGAGIDLKNSNGNFDFFATVFDALGNSFGAYAIGGPLNDVFYDFAKGPGNSFFYCGTFRDSMDADAGVNSTWLSTPNQSINSFVVYLERCLMPDLPLLSISANQVCEGSAVNVEILSGDLNDASDWTWYEDSCGGNAIATGISQFIYPSQSMNIFVRGEGGCVSTGNCNSVFVEVLPSPSISLGNDTSICIFDFMYLQVDSVYSSYQWSTGDTTNSIYLLASNYPVGLQAITLAVTDSLGCVGMDEILIDITICAKTESKKMVHENFVFPNPANNFIQLKNYATSNAQLWNIYGADGKLIKTFYTQSDHENTFVCDVSWLSNGLYFLKNQDGETFRFTVIR